MLFVVGLQLGAISVTALLALVLAGSFYAWSAILGGLIVIVPNALFGWQLARVREAWVFPAVFLAGEALKLFLTIGMLVALIRSGTEFHWVMLVTGIAIAVKAPMLGWFFERPPQSGAQAAPSSAESALTHEAVAASHKSV